MSLAQVSCNLSLSYECRRTKKNCEPEFSGSFHCPVLCRFPMPFTVDVHYHDYADLTMTNDSDCDYDYDYDGFEEIAC